MKIVGVLFLVIVKRPLQLDVFHGQSQSKLLPSQEFPDHNRRVSLDLHFDRDTNPTDASEREIHQVLALIGWLLTCLLLLVIIDSLMEASKSSTRKSVSQIPRNFIQVTLVTAPARAKVTPTLVRHSTSKSIKDTNVTPETDASSKKSTGSFRFRPGFLTKRRKSNPTDVFLTPPAKTKASSLLESIDQSQTAKLISNGNVSVVYMINDKSGNPVGIFKPYDLQGKFQPALTTSDSENLDQLTSNTKKQSLNEICAYKFDQNMTESQRAGVPDTLHVKLPGKIFNSTDSVRGSLQKFVADKESCEDFGPSLFSKESIHRIGVFDLRILNCDRHTGNFLFSPEDRHLVPIDHALSFPHFDPSLENFEGHVEKKEKLSLCDVSFDWLMFSQAKQPFSEEMLDALDSIDIVADLKIMKQMGYSVSQRLAVFMSTTILKTGALTFGKNLYELGTIIQRTGARENPSVLEVLATQTLQSIETGSLFKGDEKQIQTFCKSFTSKVDDFFRV